MNDINPSPLNNTGDQTSPQQTGIPTGPPKRLYIQMPKRKPWVVYGLLGITIIVFILQYLSTSILGYDLPFILGGKINEFIMVGEVWRFFTPMLLHGSIMHIGFNMYALYIIGIELERFYGHLNFLILYLLAAFAGNTLSFLLTANPSLGASTAIFGLIAAQGIFVYKNRFLFGKRYPAVLSRILLIVVLNLGLGLAPNIDNWGHLGGLLGGAVFAWFAGPALKIKEGENLHSLQNSTPQNKIWFTAAMVFLGIVIIAMLPFVNF